MISKTSLRALVLVTALSLTAVAAVARSTELVAPPPHTDLATATPLTPAQVRKAIIAGGTHHGWKPVADAPGVVTMMAASGQHTVTVDVPYDAHGFQVKFKSSTNMNQEQSGDRISVHPHVNRWLSDLDADILGAAQNASTASN